jgi:hypothetical protein
MRRRPSYVRAPGGRPRPIEAFIACCRSSRAANRIRLDLDSNATFEREVERNMSPDDDFSLWASYIKRVRSISANFQPVPLASSSRYPDDRILVGTNIMS